MAICYHCKQKRKIYGQKYVGEQICLECHDSLGLAVCLSTDENMEAFKKKGGYQSFDELVKIVKPRKALYDEIAAKFVPTRTFTIERPNYSGEDKIEIDDQSKTIRISSVPKYKYSENIKSPSTYIRFLDVINVTSDSDLNCLTYKLLGQANSHYFFLLKEKDLFGFLSGIK